MKHPKDAPTRFMEMNDQEREAEVARYDAEMPGTPGRPLSADGKAQHAKARRRARPRSPQVNAGAKRILVTVEAGLLRRADEYAKRHGMKRADLIAAGLSRMIESAA